MSIYNNPQNFHEAASQLITFTERDDFDTARQLRAALDVIEASDVAHVSTAIRSLTEDAIVKSSPNISPKAVDLLTVQHLLIGASNAVVQPQEHTPS